MPRNPFKCDDTVKDHFKEHHSKCTTSKRATYNITGSYLNKFLHHRPLETRKKYSICYNLKKMMDDGKIKMLTKEDRDDYNNNCVIELKRDGAIPSMTPPSTCEPCAAEQEQTDRNNRYLRRILIREECNDKKNKEKHMSHPTSCLSNNLSSRNTTQGRSEHHGYSVEQGKENASSKKSTTTTTPYIKFEDKILYHAERYRKPFKDLTFKNRMARIDDVCSVIIAACVDKNEIKEKGGLAEAIEKNDLFANECMNVVNALKGRLALKLQTKLPVDQEIANPIPLIEDDEEHDLTFDTAYAILGESTGRGYERIRSKIGKDKLPSMHHIKKNLPVKVECVEFDTSTVLEHSSKDENEGVVDMEYWDLALHGHGGSYVKNEEHALQLFSSNPDNTCIYGAKLKGSLSQWLDDVMLKKICGKSKVDDGEDIILLNCFDGAESMRSDKELKGVISFSSQVMIPSLVQQKVLKAGSSFNILTWMQVMAKEELGVLKACMPAYLLERRELVEGRKKSSLLPNSKVWTYDVHDGKLLYLLTQHSLWNRKFHPFLMCKCRRGSGTMDESHECTMWDDAEYKQYWKDSLLKWETFIAIPKEKWDLKKHKSWCDEKNFGVSHFGLKPDFFPMSTIRFDTFHLSCAVIRRLMSALRNFMLKQSSTVRDSFTDTILRSYMKNFHIFCWNNKLHFSIFKGNDLFNFVNKSEVIVKFLDNNLVLTEELRGLMKGISLLKPIMTFLKITYIESESQYKSSMDLFCKNVKDMYNAGASSFLKEHNDETFYFHCLRYYLPKIASLTFERHKLGIGIFTMQGFERRNKESKNTIHRFATTNRQSKTLLTNNVERLMMVFYNEMNAY